jgi:hypothetical protein
MNAGRSWLQGCAVHVFGPTLSENCRRQASASRKPKGGIDTNPLPKPSWPANSASVSHSCPNLRRDNRSPTSFSLNFCLVTTASDCQSLKLIPGMKSVLGTISMLTNLDSLTAIDAHPYGGNCSWHLFGYLLGMLLPSCHRQLLLFQLVSSQLVQIEPGIPCR